MIITKLSALSHDIEKLLLQPGDILVIRDEETLVALRGQSLPSITFPVPLLFVPGGLEKATRQQLLDCLSVLDTIAAAEIVIEEEASDVSQPN
jgi:hypothetical protein